MKSILQVLLFFVAFLYLVPSAVLLCQGRAQGESTAAISSAGIYTPTQIYESIKILDTVSGEIKSYPIEEYIISSLMAQIPYTFEDDALLAQAILINTYAIKRIEAEAQSPTAALNGAHLSDDYSKYLPFYTKEQAELMYKENYQSVYERFESIARTAQNYILCYEHTPINVAFHSISAGKTESSQSAWGVSVEYLQAVDSSWDNKIAGFQETKEFTADEIKARLEQSFDITFSTPKADWLIVVDKSENGYVREVLAGDNGTSLSGAQIAAAINLRSPNFYISYNDIKNTFTFTTKGGGHLVGLSQYGANTMAKENKTATEILTYYFTGTEVLKIEADKL